MPIEKLEQIIPDYGPPSLRMVIDKINELIEAVNKLVGQPSQVPPVVDDGYRCPTRILPEGRERKNETALGES